MNYLNDKWEVSGNNLEKLWNTVNIMNEKIEVIETTTDKLTLYSIQNKVDDVFHCCPLKPFNMWSKFKANNNLVVGFKQKYIDIHSWLKTGYNKELIDECYLEDNKLLISVDDSEPCFISKEAIRKLCKMLTFGGQTINDGSLERDLLLCKLCELEIPIKVIISKNKDIRKIISIVTNKYNYESHIFLKEVIQSINNPIISCNWTINHEILEMKIIFENNIKLNISNSNTGNGAFNLKYYQDNKVILDTCQKHYKSFNVNETILKIKQIKTTQPLI